MDCARFIKVQLITITHPHLDQFCLQLKLVITTLQNFLYHYWSSLQSMNILSRFLFICQRHFFDKDPNLFMTSFDSQSLFTNIPLYETIHICVYKIFEKRNKINNMLACHFKQPLILSVKSSCFLFNGVYYKQIDGAVIVSPLGLTLANLFLVSWALESCPI